LEHRLTIIGSAYVEIRALDTYLRRDIDNAIKKINDVTLDLRADVNLAPVRRQIDELRAELKANPLKFSAEVDNKNLISGLADAHKLYEDNPLHIVSHTDTTPMETALQSIRERFREMPSHVNANANTARAEAQLETVSRKRTATIAAKIKIDPEITKALQALKYTMMGAVPAPAIQEAIAGVLGNIEQLSIGMAKMSTKVGSAGAALLTLGANAFSVAGDLGSLSGIVAALPAAFSGMLITLTASHLAWNNFGNAMSSNAKTAAKALALLPPEAQTAAKSLKGLWEQVTKPAQKAFWVEMGTSLQDTVKKMVPVAKEGFITVETSLGKMTKTVLQSFATLAGSGGLKILFDNVGLGLDKATKAVTPFFDAMNRLSVTGSKYLPIFGDWLAKSADRFDAFITKADEAGKINVWINTAVANLKDLGGILGSTVDIFGGLVKISDMSGGKGLHDMADGMKDIAKTVNGEPFTSRLVLILEGARKGMDALGGGLGKIMDVAGKSAVALSEFMSIAGSVGGQFLTNISKVFDGTGFGDGFVTFLFAVQKSMKDLEPTFRNFGGIMGDFSQIASVVLVNMVPGLNSLFETLKAVIDGLRDGVVKTIPIFNDFVQNILVVAAPIAITLAQALGNILSFFASLPSFVQNGILTFGLFLVVLSKLKKMFGDTADGEVQRFGKAMNNLAKGDMEGFKKAMNESSDGALGKFGQALANTKEKLNSTFGPGSPIHDGFSTIGISAGYAKDAVVKAFTGISDSVKLTGMYIGDGFKATFSQVGDQMKKLAGPAKEFGAMMRAVFAEALLPQEVRDGFKRVGASLAEVARIYTGYFTAAKDSIIGIGKSLASAFPASLLGPALKALPAEIGQTMVWAGQKVAAGVADIAKTLAGPAVGFAMEKMKQVIQDQSLYASKRLEDIGKGVQTAVEAIQKAPAAVKSALSTLASSASDAFGKIRAEGAKVFNSAILAAAINPMTAPFVQMADAAKTAASTAAAHISNMATAVGAAINTATVPARVAFSELSTAASIHAGIIADKFQIAASRVGGNFSTAFSNAAKDLANVGAGISNAMGSAFTGVTTAASTAANAVRTTFTSAMGALKENFAPAGAAIRETFSGLGQMLSPAGTALGEIGTAAKNTMGAIGTAAGSGLKGAASGLLGVLGGPWGIALAAATTALTMYADSLAESKAKTDALAASLDQGSATITGATKKLLASNSLDGVTNDWDNFVRGVAHGSKSTEESLGKLGTSTQQYVDKLADSSSRDSYVKGMDDIATAMRRGRPVTDQMAAAIGSTKEALKGVNGNDMAHLAEKAKNAAKELSDAEEKVRKLGEATGTSSVQAQILSKNYDVLASTTSSASDKFSALKQNLDLLNQSTEAKNNKASVSVNAEKAYQQTLSDTKTALDEVIKKNDGLVGNLYTVGKGFDLTSQAGRDLHTALDGQSDAILKIGTAAMDQALKAGKSTTEANAIAVAAMAPGVANLRDTMAKIGLSAPQIDAVIKSFGLMPDQIKTAISVDGAEEAQKKILLTKLAADTFTSGNFKATLGALPDDAKAAIAAVTGKGKEFADGNYQAVLDALDKTGVPKEQALAALLAVSNGDYTSFLKAMNITGPAAEEAKKTIALVLGKSVDLKAVDGVSPIAAQARQAIDTVKDKTVTILSLFRTSGTPGDPSSDTDGIPASLKRANGGLTLPSGAEMFANGGFSNLKSFAGGGLENHIAQISAGQTPFRVWSEPETGGEAYIPLSPAKRPRSLKILDQVAEMFGFSLVRKLRFANGGIMAAMPKSTPSPRSVQSASVDQIVRQSATGSSSPTVITNIYPSQGLNEEQIGESAANYMYWKLSTSNLG